MMILKDDTMRDSSLKNLENVKVGNYLVISNKFLDLYFKVIEVSDSYIKTKDNIFLGIVSKFQVQNKNKMIFWPKYDINKIESSPLTDTSFKIKAVSNGDLNVDKKYIIE